MVNVNVYDVRKEGNLKLSKNFTVREFACSDGSPIVLVDTRLVSVIQKIRAIVDEPVYINSAYRTYSHNKKVGGAPYSQHMYGTAADIRLGSGDVKKLYNAATVALGDFGGLGLYKTFVHVDVREGRSRWNG